MQNLKQRLMAKKSRGFTMVELIIVIALIAALAIAAVIGYRALNTSAQDQLVRQEAAFIARTLNQYNQMLTTGQPRITGVAAPTATPPTLAIPTVANGIIPLQLTSTGTTPNSLITLDLSIIVTGDNTAAALARVTYNSTSQIWQVS